MRKVCLVCGDKRPRRLRTGIAWKHYDARAITFCSLKCAGAYGLRAAQGGCGGMIEHWCPRHGWQAGGEGEASCYACDSEQEDADLSATMIEPS